MINSLWIPPKIPLNILRLIFWFLLANLSVRELYNDIETWGKMTRVKNPISGKCRWLAFFTLFTEIFISIKFLKDEGNMMENPTPIFIWLPWLSVTLFIIIYYFYLRFKKNHIKKYPREFYLAKESESGLNGEQIK
jgi:phosphatidylserine synthase 2